MREALPAYRPVLSFSRHWLLDHAPGDSQTHQELFAPGTVACLQGKRLLTPHHGQTTGETLIPHLYHADDPPGDDFKQVHQFARLIDQAERNSSRAASSIRAVFDTTPSWTDSEIATRHPVVLHQKQGRADHTFIPAHHLIWRMIPQVGSPGHLTAMALLETRPPIGITGDRHLAEGMHTEPPGSHTPDQRENTGAGHRLQWTPGGRWSTLQVA